MRMIEMKRTDLGELYILLEMYGRTYGGVPENLLERIKCAYRRQGGEQPIRNVRGAGRKSRNNAEQICRAKELREKGCKIREIAEEMGYSIGYVHKLINEHPGEEEKN